MCDSNYTGTVQGALHRTAVCGAEFTPRELLIKRGDDFRLLINARSVFAEQQIHN